jgi:hypothetical protein
MQYDEEPITSRWMELLSVGRGEGIIAIAPSYRGKFAEAPQVTGTEQVGSFVGSWRFPYSSLYSIRMTGLTIPREGNTCAPLILDQLIPV